MVPTPSLLLRGSRPLLESAEQAPPVDVLIRAGRIVGVGPAAERDHDAEVVDLQGRYLVPALIDVHLHLDALSGPMLESLRDAGVLTVRNPASFPGEGATGEPRREAAGVRALSAGPPLDAPPPSFPGAVCVQGEEEARRAVRDQAVAGFPLVKLYCNLPPLLVRAAVEEAHARRMKVIGDLRATSWTEAARAGIDFLCHLPRHPDLLPPAAREGFLAELRAGAAHPLCRWLDLVDLEGPEVTELAELLVERRVAVDPTLVSIEAALFSGDPEYQEEIAEGFPPGLERPRSPRLAGPALGELRRRAGRAWRRALELVALLHHRGVLLLAGTDAPRPWVLPGPSLHRELRHLQAAGLSRTEAGRAATEHAARALGLDQALGGMAPGQLAELLVLRAPEITTASIEEVIQGGAIRRPRER